MRIVYEICLTELVTPGLVSGSGPLSPVKVTLTRPVGGQCTAGLGLDESKYYGISAEKFELCSGNGKINRLFDHRGRWCAFCRRQEDALRC